ncbi:MAG: hypothetical protein M1840_001179 [Geoglossum simile]|nr:MAG: hypothetical protein M1840_001179 [Geoglossum simile]
MNQIGQSILGPLQSPLLTTSQPLSSQPPSDRPVGKGPPAPEDPPVEDSPVEDPPTPRNLAIQLVNIRVDVEIKREYVLRAKAGLQNAKNEGKGIQFREKTVSMMQKEYSDSRKEFHNLCEEHGLKLFLLH